MKDRNVYSPNVRKKKIDVRELIKSRLSLQTNKRILEEQFHMEPSEVLSDNLYHFNPYLSWDEKKRESFIHLISGPVYQNLGRKFIEGKVKELEQKSI